MNSFLQNIHLEYLIIYRKEDNYYVIDNAVYILKALGFNYCLKNNRKVIFIEKNYLNYILNVLKNNNISFLLIDIGYQYNKIYQYDDLSNKYYYYKRIGKRIIKRENKINRIIDILREVDDICLLGEIEMMLNDCNK